MSTIVRSSSRALRLLVLWALIFSFVPTRSIAAQPDPQTPLPAKPAVQATDTQDVYLPLVVTWQSLDFQACLVTDSGGIGDHGFNAGAWQGVVSAVSRYRIQGRYLQAQSQTQYEQHINTFISQGCEIIVTVGFMLADATQAAAQAHPAQKFTIVDVTYEPTIPNVLGQYYASDQAAFLAGYLAAGTSSTGKVGTFGGIQIDPVVTFMDGFAHGVQYYNTQHGSSVEVLGWDPATETGLFTGNFENQNDGSVMAEALMDEGVDIILPVAGVCGLGAAAAIQDHGGAYLIGVDSDWYVTQPAYQDILLTSILKNIDQTTFLAIESAVNGSFAGGNLAGTLANDGVGLASYHDLAGMVSPALQAELETVKAGIAAGTIPTGP